ncbi:Mu transposase C-terminal domain-containing protein [Paracoccus rhizosphaerae]|uniref:Mu transposase C-terminal domain-containing protein n=1 Tax=Paracoccus rhizosphaerae TaxID=1133347 RepID=A0ABV6CHY3_9RHOB|nr:DDE-type integrase/transposase/recombinase [Paracoccus rhizosphaerae]
MNLQFDTSSHRYAFGLFDCVWIEGIDWRPVSSNEVGYVMRRCDETGICNQFPHAELSRLGSTGRIRLERDHFTEKAAQRRLVDAEQLISLLSARQQDAVFARKIWVEAFQEQEREKKVKRTDESIRANMGELTLKAMQNAQFLRGLNASHASAGFEFRKPPSPRSLRKWLKSYETDGLAGLVFRAHLRGNRSYRLCLTGRAWMMDLVRGYMHPDKPTMLSILKLIRLRFQERNAKREAEGLPPICPPSPETVRRAINSLDPYEVMCRREGTAAARKKFAPVGKGLQVTRPLQRVEIDEWDIDILALLADAGVLEHLTDEERLAFKLSGKKVRWKLTVAICATTRCILAMIMTPSAKASAAIQAIKMVLSDKGALSTAVRAHSAWHMHGVPDEIVTDCGSAFRSQEFQTVCFDLGISALRTVAGLPELRARIERFFRTIGMNLLPELPGRTFSSIVEKGDANPADRACLTENDLAFVLVRWVVDVYHNTLHSGLDNETPLQCWERLTKEFSVTPPPDTGTCRQIFGTKLTRKLDKAGILVLGMRYHSESLATHHRHRGDQDVEVRWLPSDIGAIEVRIGKDWMTVPAVMDQAHGLGAQLWMSAVRQVRAADPDRKRHDEKVVLAALRDIRERSEDAQAAMGLLVEDWSGERLRREEQKLMTGFEAGPAPQKAAHTGGTGRSVVPDHEATASSTSPHVAKGRRSKGNGVDRFDT